MAVSRALAHKRIASVALSRRIASLITRAANALALDCWIDCHERQLDGRPCVSAHRIWNEIKARNRNDPVCRIDGTEVPCSRGIVQLMMHALEVRSTVR